MCSPKELGREKEIWASACSLVPVAQPCVMAHIYYLLSVKLYL